MTVQVAACFRHCGRPRYACEPQTPVFASAPEHVQARHFAAGRGWGLVSLRRRVCPQYRSSGPGPCHQPMHHHDMVSRVINGDVQKNCVPSAVLGGT